MTITFEIKGQRLTTNKEKFDAIVMNSDIKDIKVIETKEDITNENDN